MSEPKEADKAWMECVLERFDFSAEMMWAVPTLAGDDIPVWVENVRLELFQQTWPSVDLKDRGELTPEKVGRLVGQFYANLNAQIGPEEISPERIEAGLKTLEKLNVNRDKPGVESLFAALEMGGAVIESLTNCIERMEDAVRLALKDALDQPNYSETVDFFRGFAKAISKPGLTNRGPALSTTATSVYNKIFLHWQEVANLGSVPELRQFLIKNGLSNQMLGEPERLGKICERLKLSFRKPGRPRKLKKSDTPPK